MTREREQRIHQLISEALSRPAAERQPFLIEACGADAELFKAVLDAIGGAEDLGSFLESPAIGPRTPPRSPSSNSHTLPPSSVLRRLRSAPGIQAFWLIVAWIPLLVGASALGTARLLDSASPGFSYSKLNGLLRPVAGTPDTLKSEDEILAVNDSEVEGDIRKIHQAMLDLEPGRVVLQLRRGEQVENVTIEAVERGWTDFVTAWSRVVTGAILLVIGAIAFVLRPGSRVTWLFVIFCSTLGTHLLIFAALSWFPAEALIVESLALYASSAAGLHLFLLFPQRLLRREHWTLLLYVPAVMAGIIQISLYGNQQKYPLVAQAISGSTIFAALTALVSTGVLVAQYRRARRNENPVALARSRAVLVAVFLGLVVPAVLGSLPIFENELFWAANSFPVIIFALVMAYSMVRFNALDVDRFTAALLGYGATTALLGLVFAAMLIGIPAWLSEMGLLTSPVTSAVLTALFFLAFTRLYRRVRARIDRWFLRGELDEGTELRRLRRLADVVSRGDVTAAYRAALAMALKLHGERAEVWTRTPDGASFVRFSENSEATGVTSCEPLRYNSPLVRALCEGSGGVETLADLPFDAEAQNELWSRDLVLAAPILVDLQKSPDGLLQGDVLQGFLAVGPKRSGLAYNKRERSFLAAVASQLGIAMRRDLDKQERLGPYRLIERVGAGGMAEVFRAEKQGAVGFEMELAIKRILPHMSQNADAVTSFLDEARIAAQLQHPNIVRVLDIEKHEGAYCLVMEYMNGPSVAGLIRTANDRGTPLSLPLVAAIAESLLSALEYLHTKTGRDGKSLGLVHRDVKPANVLTNLHGEFKLTDFGIARAETRLHVTRQGFIRGTPHYMAPEQRKGKEIGPTADLYSTGMMIYELLTGQKAFHDMPAEHLVLPSLLVPHLPNGVDAFISRALAQRPEGRFQSAEEMKIAFLKAIHPYTASPRSETVPALQVLAA